MSLFTQLPPNQTSTLMTSPQVASAENKNVNTAVVAASNSTQGSASAGNAAGFVFSGGKDTVSQSSTFDRIMSPLQKPDSTGEAPGSSDASIYDQIMSKLDNQTPVSETQQAPESKISIPLSFLDVIASALQKMEQRDSANGTQQFPQSPTNAMQPPTFAEAFGNGPEVMNQRGASNATQPPLPSYSEAFGNDPEMTNQRGASNATQPRLPTYSEAFGNGPEVMNQRGASNATQPPLPSYSEAFGNDPEAVRTPYTGSASNSSQEYSGTEVDRSGTPYGIPGNSFGGGSGGISSSLMDSRVGAGMGNMTGDYGSVNIDTGYEEVSWNENDTFTSNKGGAGASTENYLNETGGMLAANAGAGVSASAGMSDMEGNHALAYGAANASAGARVGVDINTETGVATSTVGAGIGANAAAGVAVGDGDSSSSVGVAAAADFSAESSVTTTKDGVPIGYAGNVGGDLGVEGEVSSSKTTDVGSSSTSLTGGADVGMGVGGEIGMRNDGTFALGGEIDLGPVGVGIQMEYDTNVISEEGKKIDARWQEGEYVGAFQDTAELTMDVLETMPAFGNVVGGARDYTRGLGEMLEEFADGDILGGLEAYGNGLLDTVENVPFAGDSIAALRDWVSDGGIKDAADEVANVAKDVGDGVKKAAEDVGDGIKDVAEDVGDGIKDVAEDVGDGIKDVAEDVGDGIKDVADDVGDGIKDVGKSIGSVFGF